MNKNRLLYNSVAYIGQFVSLFPFAFMLETLGLETLTVWHFFAAYGVWVAFWAFGLLAGKISERVTNGRKFRQKYTPIVNLLSNIGFIVPSAILIAVGIALDLEFSIYVFIMAAGIIIYFGGCLTVGKNYGGIFPKTWFVLYFVSAVIATLILALSKKTEIASKVEFMLCVGFAVITLITVVLSNQLNIDKCTNQRDSGKAVLPDGLRRYNLLIVIGIFAITTGLFVFAKPLGNLFKTVIGAVVNAVLSVTQMLSKLFKSPEDTAQVDSDGEEPILSSNKNETSNFGDVYFVLIMAVLIILVIAFRKPIWNAIKNLFAPLFKNRKKAVDVPFYDEITESSAKTLTPKAQKRAECVLSKQYERENSPERKYRLGYALFLAKLRRTKCPPEPFDTTDIHREKGESAFNENLREFSETYNKVRYADIPPVAEQLAAESELLKKLK